MPQPLAHFDRANALLAEGFIDQAIAQYRELLALKPNHAEAHSNLGVALMAAGRPAEAIASYRAALTLKPKLADTYRNLGRALVASGNVMEALELARRALKIAPTDEIKAFFAQCIRSVPLPARPHPALEDIAPTLAKALADAWGRPEDLSGLAADIVKQTFDRDSVLLRALLEAAPIRDAALERRLTLERRALLAAQGSEPDNHRLAFACALARQCFVNEYVFAFNDDELREASALRDSVVAQVKIAPLQLATVAAYFPLHSLVDAERLLLRNWPAPVVALIEQQVRQPLMEQRDRAAISVLTAIDDPVSQAVRQQYEDHPYPRWIKPTPVGKPAPLREHLRAQFRYAPLRSLEDGARTEILVAGCGTGQHAIETARRYSGARVLAVDLSVASLCYARRMTRALGLANVEYAQADILNLSTLGRHFDLIEAAGVLHHLVDPEAGWRTLLTLLKPNGLMLVGLYSATARHGVNAARRFAAERGYSAGNPDDIRRGRQELMALDDSAEAKDAVKFGDFSSMSGCRDLLFHVQEQQFTLARIRQFLTDNRLSFIGFVVDPAVQQHYRNRFPEDVAQTSLERWEAFEAAHPRTFANMYQFWVQRAA